MRIRPLQPLVPTSNAVAQTLTSPPYDVVTLPEARALLLSNPTSFLSVTRPDAVTPPPPPSSLYSSAASALSAFQTSGTLVRSPHPSLFVYEQQHGTHVQRGLVALARVQDYERGVIRRHERTRADKEADRTRLTHVLRANVGPVFLTYEDVAGVDEVVQKVVEEEVMFRVSAEDGVVHRVWKMGEEEGRKMAEAFEEVRTAYIADGHHRAASAARVGSDLREKEGGVGTGEEGFNWFLVVLFPRSQLRILAYNRVVRDLNGLDVPQFLARLGDIGRISPMKDVPSDVPAKGGTFFVYVAGNWYYYTVGSSDARGDGVAETLDAGVLQRRVLAPVLGVEDPRKSERIEFVGGVRGLSYLTKRVDTEGGVAFALHPVSVRQLMEVADRDEIMPPKSTWFEPKLRSGFFVHTF